MIIPELWEPLLGSSIEKLDISAWDEIQGDDIECIRNMYADYWASMDKPQQWLDKINHALDHMKPALASNT